MKDQIADELARGDLTSQIAVAITNAITFYQPERFRFNESRDLTFNTASGQEFYGTADNADIPTLQAFDYIILYIGSIPWPLHRRTDVEIEVLNQNGLMRGQPWNFSYFNNQIRLGPVPDTTYSMRIAAHKKMAGPTLDTDTANVWMSDGERLIRCRAKYDLSMNVTKDVEEAQRMAPLIKEAFEMLKGQANRLLGQGRVAPMEF